MDNVDPLRILSAFMLVLALIGLLALGLRYVAARKPGWGLQQAGGRIQVVETRMIDARRKLLLVRCDEVEYFLLLSPDREIVLDTIWPVKGNDA